MDQDPVSVYLGELRWPEHDESFRGLLDQVSAYRRTDEPEVEDYTFAAVGQAMLLAGLPHPIVSRVLRLLSKTPSDNLDNEHVAIINGGYLSLPTGVFTFPALKQIDNPDIQPLVTTVFSIGSFWAIAKKALCVQPA